MKKIITVLLIVILASCKKDPLPESVIGVGDNALIDTKNIEIPSYSYHSEDLNLDVSVSGDEGANQLRTEFSPEFPTPVTVYDTLSADFAIRWNSIPPRFISIGLFDANPTINTADGLQITNTDNCVWLWNSGMDFNATGEVTFKNGRSVKSVSGSQITFEDDLLPLDVAKNYALIIWAWNEDATKIEYSSRLIRIRIAP